MGVRYCKRYCGGSVIVFWYWVYFVLHTVVVQSLGNGGVLIVACALYNSSKHESFGGCGGQKPILQQSELCSFVWCTKF